MTATPLDILVVAVNYAPEPGGTAPYTTEAAEYLASLGHHVEVLTGMPHYPSWKIAAEYAGRLRVRECRNAVEVRRLRHYVPSSQSAVKRAAYESSFALHALSVRCRHPDVVLAVVPTIFGAAAAAMVARLSGARFVVWVQDSVSRGAAQTGIAGGAAVARVVAGVERVVLARADGVITISESFGGQISALGVPRSRIHIVRNWTHISPPRVSRAAMRHRMRWGDNEVIALHAGNMGLKQGLENLVDAGKIAYDEGSTVRFVLMGDGNQRRALQARAHGIPNVTFLPSVSDDDYSSVLAAANVLVVNERQGVADMSLPSKLTSYAVSGRPVLAAVQQDGETAMEVQRIGLGTVIPNDSPLQLLRAVPRLLDDIGVQTRARRAAHDQVNSERSSREAKQQIAEIVEGRGVRRA